MPFCTGMENLSHCSCTYDTVFCGNVPLNLIAEVFKNKTHPIELLKLAIPPTEDFIPKDLLFHPWVKEYRIQCINIGRQRLKIHKDAFRSSKNFTCRFVIQYCDISRLDFLFLKDFDQFYLLEIDRCVNVHLADWAGFPPLPIFQILTVRRSKGLAEWTQFPVSIHGMTRIELINNGIDDTTIDKILHWAINSSSSTGLISLEVPSNQLTRIPRHNLLFQNLVKLDLSHNALTTLQSGSLNFRSPVRLLYLSFCNIRVIEPGAFQGIITHHYIIVYFKRFFCN